MNNRVRGSIHAALKAAKYYLSPTFRCDDKEQFVCWALKRASESMMCSVSGAEKAEEMIMERLTKKHYTAECWLITHVGRKAYHKACDKDPNCIQEWRHRWLDALIEEFSK